MLFRSKYGQNILQIRVLAHHTRLLSKYVPFQPPQRLVVEHKRRVCMISQHTRAQLLLVVCRQSVRSHAHCLLVYTPWAGRELPRKLGAKERCSGFCRVF